MEQQQAKMEPDVDATSPTVAATVTPTKEPVVERMDTGLSATGVFANQPSQRETHVIVCEKEGSEAVELPLEMDGSLAVSTLQIEFVGALGLKYRNPTSGLMRILKADEEGKLKPPPDGWKSTRFIACVPGESQKRPWNASDNGDGETDSGAVEPPCKQVHVTPLTSSAPSTFTRPTFRAPMHAGGQTSFPPPRPRFPGAPSGQRRLPTKVFAFCDVCQVGLNSDTQATLHYAGKKHLENAARSSGTRNPTSAAPRPVRGRGGRPAVLPHPSSGVGGHPMQLRWPRPPRPPPPAQDFTTDSSYNVSPWSAIRQEVPLESAA